MKIAVEEWELYNNGVLLCRWFDLTDVEEEEINKYIAAVKKDHGLNYEDIESFVADVEGDDLNIIKGDESLYIAYEVQAQRDQIEDYDMPKIDFLINIQGYDLDEAIGKIEDCDFYEDMNFEDLAIEFVNEGLFGEGLQNINHHYIDFEAIGRDLIYDYTEYKGNIFRCD